jgi:hypothetical protein
MSASDADLHNFLQITGCHDIDIARNILLSTGSFDVG